MPLEDYPRPISYEDAKSLREESQLAINSLEGDLEMLGELGKCLMKAKDLAFRLGWDSHSPTQSPVYNMGNDLTRMDGVVCDVIRRFEGYKDEHDMDLRFAERRIDEFESNSPPATMLRKDFDSLGLRIQWSIYVDTSSDDIESWELDLRAPVPDGIYDALYSGYSEEVRKSGIVVNGGNFLVKPTSRTVHAVVALADGSVDGHLHHYFLEALEWNGEYFILQMGS